MPPRRQSRLPLPRPPSQTLAPPSSCDNFEIFQWTQPSRTCDAQPLERNACKKTLNAMHFWSGGFAKKQVSSKAVVPEKVQAPVVRRRRQAVVSKEVAPKPSVHEFYTFMQERERLRIRKDIKRLPRDEWTGDPIIQSVRLTNVCRENDRTTHALRTLTQEQATIWRNVDSAPEPLEAPSSPRRLWTVGQLRMAGLFVFNCALWRAFGTTEFAMAAGFLQDWTMETQDQTMKIALALWHNNISVFTEAYDPARRRHRVEVSKTTAVSLSRMRRVINSAFVAVEPVWHARERIAMEAYRTGSWKATTQKLMEISGYGGTGFLAKEVVQDLMHTPLFQDYEDSADSPNAASWHSVCVDENDWCAVGPGARRGLNRLAGRPYKYGVTNSSSAIDQDFLRELKELFEERHSRWPTKILDVDVAKLALHDVQFQLCEFDKYLRAMHHEGRVRLYQPPTSKPLSREELQALVADARNLVKILEEDEHFPPELRSAPRGGMQLANVF